MKKFLSATLVAFILVCSQVTFAEKTDWSEKGFNFKNIKSIIVLDATVNPNLNYGGAAELRNLQDTFIQSSKKLKCTVITEAQARVILTPQVGINIEAIYYSNPQQARQIVIQNASRIADAWIIANVDNLTNSSYVEPARTTLESKRETRTYFDPFGNKHEESYYVQIPVTQPAQRVDISTIEMSLQIHESRGGALIFSRRDVRDRKDYNAQKGMFGRICNSFFEDIAKKM